MQIERMAPLGGGQRRGKGAILPRWRLFSGDRGPPSGGLYFRSFNPTKILPLVFRAALNPASAGPGP
jgi:hypothetical protein